MDLQNWFYGIAITVMIVGIVMEIAVIAISIAAYGQLVKLKQEITEKLQIIDQIRRDPLLIARTAALKASHSFLDRLSGILAGT